MEVSSASMALSNRNLYDKRRKCQEKGNINTIHHSLLLVLYRFTARYTSIDNSLISKENVGTLNYNN